jgi:hypothetical protein
MKKLCGVQTAKASFNFSVLPSENSCNFELKFWIASLLFVFKKLSWLAVESVDH